MREKTGTHSGKQTSKIDLIYMTWFTEEDLFVCVCHCNWAFLCLSPSDNEGVSPFEVKATPEISVKMPSKRPDTTHLKRRKRIYASWQQLS